MDLQALAQIAKRYKDAGVIQTIAPNDQMWASGPDWYFTVGESAINTILSGLSLSWQHSTAQILDLPCGHGRVTRHLRSAFPDSTIFVSDLDQSGVTFCSETFNATPIFSKPELTDVDIPQDLDLIWIGSLFTHLDEARTFRWLRYLCQHLSKHGVLVATFHGLWSIEQQNDHPMINATAWNNIMAQYRATGFGYDRYTEFDLGDYGISVSSAAKIMEMATAIPDIRILTYTERGWANNHDVLIVTRNDRLAR